MINNDCPLLVGYKPWLETHKAKKDKKMHWLVNNCEVFTLGEWCWIMMMNNGEWRFIHINDVQYCSAILVMMNNGMNDHYGLETTIHYWWIMVYLY